MPMPTSKPKPKLSISMMGPRAHKALFMVTSRPTLVHQNKLLICFSFTCIGYYVGPVEPDALVQDIMSWRMSWMASFENWYHGKISRSEVEEKLRISPDGSFLVRESATYPGSYALSTKHQGQIKHRIVHSTRGDSGSSYQLKGSGKCFHKITDLVMYYRNNYISTDGEILRTPCSRSTPNEVHARRFPGKLHHATQHD